jgi:5-methylcytosine-specific restriction endonuclease McrA
MYLVKRPPIQRKMTRIEIFSRDKFTCQYCGKEAKELTLDHVMPRHRGGEHTWENVVSCCVPCNRRKAGKTPSEAGMKLFKQPSTPRPGIFTIPYQYLRSQDQWKKFIGERS